MATGIDVDALVEKDRISGVLNTLFAATDARDWPAVQDCFADSVLFDMTSLAGGEPARVSPAQIVEGWEAGLRPIEQVHHQVGNLAIDVTGDEANARCYGIAYHYRKTYAGANTRAFVGSYDFHLVRDEESWRIDLFRFRLKFVDGNADLEKEP